MKDFKPMLAPNEKTDLTVLEYPLLASNKLDGIRNIFLKGQNVTRSLKKFPNQQISEKFDVIRQYSEKNSIILDGEAYAPNVPFPLISSCCMTHDWYDKKSVKAWEELQLEHEIRISREEVLERMKFFMFDTLLEDPNEPFEKRLERAWMVCKKPELINVAEYVRHHPVNCEERVMEIFQIALDEGLEGLILRNPIGRYKFNRGTLKENLIYKVKPWETLDAQITGVLQSTEVNEDAEKKINELGRSVTSKKKDDRHLIEKAYGFTVLYEGQEVKVNLKMKDPQKVEVWLNRESYIGRWIEYKYMVIGAKDLPRFPTMIRFREDKDA